MDLKVDHDIYFDIIDDELGIDKQDGCYYSYLSEEIVNDKKYYKIGYEFKEYYVTCIMRYLIFDPARRIVVENISNKAGNYTTHYWDEYENELIIRRHEMDIDLNESSLFELLMAGVTYINALNIIELRNQGVTITKENVRNLLEFYGTGDYYFLIRIGLG